MIFGKLVYAVIKKIINESRTHDFDLEHPIIEECHGKQIEKYECKKCGEKISLNKWQMKSLPFGMKHGCRGYK